MCDSIEAKTFREERFIDYKIYNVNDRLISVLFYKENFYSGAVHPSYSFDGFNYDLLNGVFMSYNNFFNQDSEEELVEILNEDGTMARRPELEKFAEKHAIKIGTIADLIHYRVLNEKTVELIDEGPIATDYGEFVLQRYRDTLYGNVHFVMKKGEFSTEEPVLTRVHVANTVRDVMLANVPGNEGWNMPRAMKAISDAGKGVIVLLASSETEKALLYSSDIVMGHEKLPEAHPSEATEINLSIGLGSQLIREAGVRKMHLMSNPVKYNAISGFDLEVVDYIAYSPKTGN